MGPVPPPHCCPPWWARGAHAQTLLGHWLPSTRHDLPWEILDLPLQDGDVLRARLLPGAGRVVTLFHGLGGNAGRDYVLRAAAAFRAAGDALLVVNHRGAGEGRGLARHPYHSGVTGDLAAAFRFARGRFPDRRHLGIGYSLSGSILLLLLGRDSGDPAGLPDAAISVNPPADLEHCSRLLGQGLNRLYDLRFVRLLRQEVRARWELGLLDAPVHIPAMATLRDFDRIFTAPQAGFRDRDDYYSSCSCGPHLAGIRTPTVVLTSEDDPIAPAEQLRRWTHGPGLHLHVESHGGHMGYLDRNLPQRRWLEPALLHFAARLLPITA